MKVENIPYELLDISYSYEGGTQYPDWALLPFLEKYPSSEDRTADSIMMEAYLSITNSN